MENRAPVCLIKAGAARVCRPCEPHPPRFARHLPLKGKACGRPKAAPTAENGPGALVRRRQAQNRNCTSPKFLPAQAPSGAGRDRAQALLILRAGNSLPAPRDNPRNGGPGKGDYEHEVLIGAVPGGVLVTLPPRAKSLAARRQRNPPATNATIPSSPPHPSRLRRATFPPGGRLKMGRRRNPLHKSEPTAPPGAF